MFVCSFLHQFQQVALDPESRNCAYPNFPGHVLHELIHAVGFFHEHARDDRDNYIEIMYDNLSDGMSLNSKEIKFDLKLGCSSKIYGL
jgi:hypothetical protein